MVQSIPREKLPIDITRLHAEVIVACQNVQRFNTLELPPVEQEVANNELSALTHQLTFLAALLGKVRQLTRPESVKYFNTYGIVTSSFRSLTLDDFVTASESIPLSAASIYNLPSLRRRWITQKNFHFVASLERAWTLQHILSSESALKPGHAKLDFMPLGLLSEVRTEVALTTHVFLQFGLARTPGFDLYEKTAQLKNLSPNKEPSRELSPTVFGPPGHLLDVPRFLQHIRLYWARSSRQTQVDLRIQMMSIVRSYGYASAIAELKSLNLDPTPLVGWGASDLLRYEEQYSSVVEFPFWVTPDGDLCCHFPPETNKNRCNEVYLGSSSYELILQLLQHVMLERRTNIDIPILYRLSTSSEPLDKLIGELCNRILYEVAHCTSARHKVEILNRTTFLQQLRSSPQHHLALTSHHLALALATSELIDQARLSFHYDTLLYLDTLEYNPVLDDIDTQLVSRQYEDRRRWPVRTQQAARLVTAAGSGFFPRIVNARDLPQQPTGCDRVGDKGLATDGLMFVRSHKAVRVTSAAPTFFAPFVRAKRRMRPVKIPQQPSRFAGPGSEGPGTGGLVFVRTITMVSITSTIMNKRNKKLSSLRRACPNVAGNVWLLGDVVNATKIYQSIFMCQRRQHRALPNRTTDDSSKPRIAVNGPPFVDHVDWKLAELNMIDGASRPLHVSFFRILLPMLRRCVWKLYMLSAESPPPGYTRLEWTCSCGKFMYGDFREASPGSLRNLAKKLGGRVVTHPPAGARSSQPPITISSLPHAHIIAGSGSISSRLEPPHNRGVAPPTTATTTAHNFPALLERKRKFLEVCVRTGRFTHALGEIDVSGTQCDRTVFEKIRQKYKETRKTFLVFGKYPLRRPAAAHFVRFRIDSRPSIGIMMRPSYPPDSEVLAGRYEYMPVPMDEPPMPPDTFIHYFNNITTAHSEALWVSRFPLKLNESLLFSAERLAQGWGVEIAEKPNWSLFCFAMVVALLLSGVVAGLYGYYNQDASTGVAIGAWLTSVQTMLAAALFFMWE